MGWEEGAQYGGHQHAKYLLDNLFTEFWVVLGKHRIFVGYTFNLINVIFHYHKFNFTKTRKQPKIRISNSGRKVKDLALRSRIKFASDFNMRKYLMLYFVT